MRAIFLLSVILAASSLAYSKDKYGEPLSKKDAVPLSKLLDSATKSESPVTTIAKVENVCEKKGCWMILKDKDAEVRVTFKGYKYFVPISLRGKTVKVEGVLETKTVSVEEQRHYLEDEGASKESIAKITKPKKTHRFVATGVEVTKG